MTFIERIALIIILLAALLGTIALINQAETNSIEAEQAEFLKVLPAPMYPCGAGDPSRSTTKVPQPKC